MRIHPDPELGFRALTVRQPYASEIARGEKGIEYRSWPTPYRGDLLITASARADDRDCSDPLACAICIVTLADVARPSELGISPVKLGLAPDEDLCCWLLQKPRAVPNVKVKGRLQLWTPDAALIRALGVTW